MYLIGGARWEPCILTARFIADDVERRKLAIARWVALGGTARLNEVLKTPLEPIEFIALSRAVFAGTGCSPSDSAEPG